MEVIEASKPDLVMLDVQMPGLTGFEVAQRLYDDGVETQLVFITAFDQHAIQAFEINAVDYLLKPVEAERLGTAVERVRRRLASERGLSRPNTPELDRLLQLLSQRQGHRDQLAVKISDRFLLIQADEVVHASVENDVITVVTNSLSGTSNYRTLDELQARLDPAIFWRLPLAERKANTISALSRPHREGRVDRQSCGAGWQWPFKTGVTTLVWTAPQLAGCLILDS